MIRRCLLVATAIVAAACTSATDVADRGSTTAPAPSVTSSTVTMADGVEVVAPDPDPTPIEPSDEVRIGTLDNGLTYYVRSNQAPGGGLSLRLAVDAGSLQQDGPESGVAHFVEHMLFNGTERFPGNELARALQRIGVEFGPDLNAYTSFDETVYQLDLVGITDETVAIGFDVLAQWASAATIEQEATIAERGVVREEIRLRDEGADGAIATAFDDVYARGTAYAGREPGGRAELILETDAEELRTFYDRWYRPDLMAVIAVGDLPVDRLEEEVRQRFSDLEARGDSPERIRPGVEPIDVPVAEVVTHPEVARAFSSIDYSITSWDQSTVGGERLTLIQNLYALMIGNRLRDAVDRGEADLDQPFVTRFDHTRVQAFLGFNFDSPDLAAGTGYVLREMGRLALAGFTAAEHGRAAAEVRAVLDQLLASAASTQDHEYADDYVAHFLTGAQISSAAATHGRLTAALEEITAAEVTDLFRWEMSRAAPIVIVVGRDADALPTVADLEAVIEAAGDVTGDHGGEGEVAIDELMDRPDPVDPVETSAIDEPAATEWVFGNGVTVRFVESDIAANQVDLLAVGEGGWSLLAAADAVVAPYAVAAAANSGVGEHDRLAVRRYLAGSTTSLSPFIDETSEGFVGASGADDVEILLQRLHLAVTAARVDELALRETVDVAGDRARLVETDAELATLNALAGIRFRGDERFAPAPPAPPALDGLSTERALELYNRRLGTVDDLVVAIVGDVAQDEVSELARHYLGTLPAGEPDTWADVRPDAIAAVIRRSVSAGSGEATGTVGALYPTEIEIDAPTRIRLMVLERIFSARILDVVREELGASYGGSAIVEVRTEPTEGADVVLLANIAPERGREILDVMVGQALDLATNGPTDDELDRARSVLRSDFDLVGNRDLIDMLLTEPDEEVLTPARRSRLLGRITAADIRALAAQVLPPAVRAEVITAPAGP